MTLICRQSMWVRVKLALAICACSMGLFVHGGPPGSTLRTYKRTDWLERAKQATPLQQSSAPTESTLRPYKRTDWIERAKQSDPTELSSSPTESTLQTHRPSTWSVPSLQKKTAEGVDEDRSTLQSHRAPKPEGRYRYLRDQFEQRMQRYRKMQKAMQESGHTHMVDYLEESIKREQEYFDKKLRRLGLGAPSESGD